MPIAFVAAGVLAALIAHHADDAPKVAFENHFVFAAQLFLLIFYAILLLLVPLVRGIASGELPVELTARGARFPEQALKGSLTANQELLERIEGIEKALKSQKATIDGNAEGAGKGLLDLEADIEALRLEIEQATGGPRP